jgi:hypothetical protein
MKHLALIVILLSMTGCAGRVSGDNYESTAIPLKAIYLIHGQSELSSEDLQAHPEVVTVQTFDDFKKYTQQKIALWIDKSATPFTPDQQEWINEAPQAYYPIVLVGYSDILYSFRDLLGICCFEGPPIDQKLEAGFSVIQVEETNEPTSSPNATFLKGYNQTPTAQSLLEITNALLEGRSKPTPTATFLPIATPTP